LARPRSIWSSRRLLLLLLLVVVVVAAASRDLSQPQRDRQLGPSQLRQPLLLQQQQQLPGRASLWAGLWCSSRGQEPQQQYCQAQQQLLHMA
jgi:hypothetical protein